MNKLNHYIIINRQEIQDSHQRSKRSSKEERKIDIEQEEILLDYEHCK
jgi:hypothetical protein